MITDIKSTSAVLVICQTGMAARRHQPAIHPIIQPRPNEALSRARWQLDGDVDDSLDPVPRFCCLPTTSGR
jgi:hypothetical protein